VSIDFAYAQARAQARLGERLPEAGWRALESSLGLPQYLASARSTVLVAWIADIPLPMTPHGIERALRATWRMEVDHASRWVPERWRGAVAWTAWLPWLDAIAWLLEDRPVPPWMHEDPVMADLALDDPAARRQAIAASPFGALADAPELADPADRWLRRWQAMWPTSNAEQAAGLQALTHYVREFGGAAGHRGARLPARREARELLERRTVRLMHGRIEQPVVVFAHLLLEALSLLRLRDGLLRRCLFDDDRAERTP